MADVLYFIRVKFQDSAYKDFRLYDDTTGRELKQKVAAKIGQTADGFGVLFYKDADTPGRWLSDDESLSTLFQHAIELSVLKQRDLHSPLRPRKSTIGSLDSAAHSPTPKRTLYLLGEWRRTTRYVNVRHTGGKLSRILIEDTMNAGQIIDQIAEHLGLDLVINTDTTHSAACTKVIKSKDTLRGQGYVGDVTLGVQKVKNHHLLYLEFPMMEGQLISSPKVSGSLLSSKSPKKNVFILSGFRLTKVKNKGKSGNNTELAADLRYASKIDRYPVDPSTGKPQTRDCPVFEIQFYSPSTPPLRLAAVSMEEKAEWTSMLDKAVQLFGRDSCELGHSSNFGKTADNPKFRSLTQGGRSHSMTNIPKIPEKKEEEKKPEKILDPEIMALNSSFWSASDPGVNNVEPEEDIDPSIAALNRTFSSNTEDNDEVEDEPAAPAAKETAMDPEIMALNMAFMSSRDIVAPAEKPKSAPPARAPGQSGRSGVKPPTLAKLAKPKAAAAVDPEIAALNMSFQASTKRLVDVPGDSVSAISPKSPSADAAQAAAADVDPEIAALNMTFKIAKDTNGGDAAAPAGGSTSERRQAPAPSPTLAEAPVDPLIAALNMSFKQLRPDDSPGSPTQTELPGSLSTSKGSTASVSPASPSRANRPPNRPSSFSAAKSPTFSRGLRKHGFPAAAPPPRPQQDLGGHRGTSPQTSPQTLTHSDNGGRTRGAKTMSVGEVDVSARATRSDSSSVNELDTMLAILKMAGEDHSLTDVDAAWELLKSTVVEPPTLHPELANLASAFTMQFTPPFLKADPALTTATSIIFGWTNLILSSQPSTIQLSGLALTPSVLSILLEQLEQLRDAPEPSSSAGDGLAASLNPYETKRALNFIVAYGFSPPDMILKGICKYPRASVSFLGFLMKRSKSCLDYVYNHFQSHIHVSSKYITHVLKTQERLAQKLKLQTVTADTLLPTVRDGSLLCHVLAVSCRDELPVNVKTQLMASVKASPSDNFQHLLSAAAMISPWSKEDPTFPSDDDTVKASNGNTEALLQIMACVFTTILLNKVNVKRHPQLLAHIPKKDLDSLEALMHRPPSFLLTTWVNSLLSRHNMSVQEIAPGFIDCAVYAHVIEEVLAKRNQSNEFDSEFFLMMTSQQQAEAILNIVEQKLGILNIYSPEDIIHGSRFANQLLLGQLFMAMPAAPSQWQK